MLSFTYERRFKSHPDYPQLWSIRKAVRELLCPDAESFGPGKYPAEDQFTERPGYGIEIRINASLFAEARVIACTLVSSANRLLEGQKFGTLFIDEAAKASGSSLLDSDP